MGLVILLSFLFFMFIDLIYINRKMFVLLENQKTMFSILHRIDDSIDEILDDTDKK